MDFAPIKDEHALVVSSGPPQLVVVTGSGSESKDSALAVFGKSVSNGGIRGLRLLKPRVLF